ncbi:MAG: sel1 repeat family protein [Pseudomonadota bacterium]|nr:sel1 repeat family protein [Pseudomonadota bacterium]
MKNPNAYLTAGAMLTGIALFFGLVWLIIMNNMSDDYIAQAPETESERPAIREAVKPNRDPAAPLNAANALDVPPSNGARIAAGAKPTVPRMEKLPDDHHFAVQLYQENAEKGNSDAQYKLGLLYLTGNGALQDFTEAAKWLKLAAEQGYALAQYELGLIYRSGYGLATDQVQSYMWLNIAAAAGIKQAVMVRDEVMRSLSTKQLAQAQKSSREWLASRPKPKPQASEAEKAINNDVQPGTIIPQSDTLGGIESKTMR